MQQEGRLYETVSYDVMPCSLANSYQSFGGTCYSIFHSDNGTSYKTLIFSHRHENPKSQMVYNFWLELPILSVCNISKGITLYRQPYRRKVLCIQ
jgi:hypothetical protein